MTISDVKYGEIIALSSLRLPVREIAETLKVSERVCRYWLNKSAPPSSTQHVSSASFSEIRARRRKVVVALASTKHVVNRNAFTPKRRKQKDREFTLRPWNSPAKICSELRRNHGIAVSASTVRRDLISGGLKAKKRRKVSFMSEKGRAYRLEFCKWAVKTKPCIMFSDEKEFNCNEDTNRWEWLAATEPRSGARCERDGAKLGVWGCIGPDGTAVIRTYVKENLTREKYRAILQTALPELRSMSGKKSVFMQDGARPHCGALEWLKKRHVNVLEADWPALSSDLNPIEQFWSILDRRVKEQAPYGVEELEKFIREEAARIPKATVQALVASFVGRCKKVIDAKGGFIKP